MLKDIKGVIFDYGGTIDTNSRHWAEVLWSKYAEYHVPVDKESLQLSAGGEHCKLAERSPGLPAK